MAFGHDEGMHEWPVPANADVPSPALVAAWLTLGTLPTERIPLFASHWLADGHDGRALAELAGLHGDDPHDVRDLLPEALAECGAGVMPSDEAAALTAFTALAQLQTDGLARERWIVDKVTEVVARTDYSTTVTDLPLGSLFGLDDEWGAGWGRSDAELAARVREACAEQLQLAATRRTA
jgi:hypothetical protein